MWVGCTDASAGCLWCFAKKDAWRLGFNPATPYYAGLVDQRGHWTGHIARAPQAKFDEPLSVAAPTVWFCNSESDFFHAQVPDFWISDALSVMDRCPQHTFQILTKRPERINDVLRRLGRTLPPNVWMGASVENAANKWRIDELVKVAATIRFLSCEPLIGSLGALPLGGLHWLSITHNFCSDHGTQCDVGEAR